MLMCLLAAHSPLLSEPEQVLGLSRIGWEYGGGAVRFAYIQWKGEKSILRCGAKGNSYLDKNIDIFKVAADL